MNNLEAQSKVSQDQLLQAGHWTELTQQDGLIHALTLVVVACGAG